MKEIDTIDGLVGWLNDSAGREPVAIQALDLMDYSESLLRISPGGSLFLGCKMAPDVAAHLAACGAITLPNIDAFSFQVHRPQLYPPEALFAGFDGADPKGYEKTLDARIYQEYLEQGGAAAGSILVTLARRLHDHSISDALEEQIAGRKVVAIMGGHSMERQDPVYEQVARLSRTLTRLGYLMVSGGGPGAMEATHLGAFLAPRDDSDLSEALGFLKPRPEGAVSGKEYADQDWLHRAWRVMEHFPIPEGHQAEAESIGIPTWLYGHEPPSPFATQIAKYFANAVREDGLLAIAKHGVIFAPGSAGTTQEIFQDVAQNHYATTGFISPMILFGTNFWTDTRPVWPLLQEVARGQRFGEILALTDDEVKIIELIQAYDPEEYRG
ncbi:MAG: hypothetical protein K0U98_21485 [Deltaproteobacteria bacterium]|nr:hypothetical protein [Deltaproteobacteria bacterium]